MSGMATSALTPTWTGHITSAREALILFEACLVGELHHVPRRPHDRERPTLIKSGSVFIYEENASGIKRWTDGVPWSPSRLLGNFLIYRELKHPFPPGEKKRATKKKNRVQRPSDASPAASASSPAAGRADIGLESREQERALIGSLVDSYLFKEDGLVKKTMSVTLHGVSHHLVSYYTVKDVMEGSLLTPSTDQRLSGVNPRTDLLIRQNFRAPVDDNVDGLAEQANGPQPGGYMYPDSYDRHGMMLPTSPAHPPPPGHMQMGYGHFAPGAPNMPPGMHPYDPHANYYSQQQSMASPNRTPAFDRSPVYAPPPQQYGYGRPQLPEAIAPGGAAPRPQPSNGWDRNHTGQDAVYSGQPPQPGMNPHAYPPSGNTWPMSPPESGLNLPPPPETGWHPGEGGWPPMNQPSPSDRSHGYQRGSNGYGGLPPGYNPPSSKP